MAVSRSSLSTRELRPLMNIYTKEITSKKIIGLTEFNIPQHNLSKFKKSPIYRTIKSWNKAPVNLPFGKIKPHKSGFQKHLLNENQTNIYIYE